MKVEDRSPNCRALILHPQFKDRHPIYHLFDKHLQVWRFVQVPRFSVPFLIHQNYVSSHENLGSVVWAAGIAAATYISDWLLQEGQQHHETWTLLELGCGTSALVSQCASLCGAQCVMTDLPEVLEWAIQNVKLNSAKQWKERSPAELQKAKARSNRNSIAPLLSAATLRWGEESDLEKLFVEQHPKINFDIIVAADCLYATQENLDLQTKLLSTLKALLLNNHGGARSTKLFISYQLRTGKERIFVHEVLPMVFPNYVIEPVIIKDSGNRKVKKNLAYEMVWFIPKQQNKRTKEEEEEATVSGT